MITFENFVIEDDSPIYLQINRFIKRGIVAGIIQNQDEVPSRRMLSALLGVNPNTIQKAYHLLEEEGIMVSQTGAKSFVTINEEDIQRIRMELLNKETKLWVNAMREMRVSKEEASELLNQIWEEQRR